jgi:hypothetical protein
LVNILVKGCRLWDKLTEKMNNGEYTIPVPLRSYKLDGSSGYQSLDYNNLDCRITGNLAEIKVGDADDHKTKIDLTRKILDYHDPDDPTNIGVAELLRSVGLRCQVMESRGVRCTGMTAKKAVMVFKTMVMVPSMDRRMENCRAKGASASECRKLELKFFVDTVKKEKLNG